MGAVVVDWQNSYVERSLVAAGFHPSSPWWTDVIERVNTDEPRVVVVRAGRRAGKSVHTLRWALDQAVSRQWNIDPGDVGILAIVSARRWQAEDRVATLRKYIQALDLEIIRDTNARIDVQLPWGVLSVRALSATGGDVVSGTFICVLLDEVARWIDDRGRNPASEVIASIRPSLLSTGGCMWLISSPMTTDDAHAKAFAKGDTGAQLVFHAPTWVANNTITEEECRELEPDELLFQREYAAVPLSTDGGLWLNSALIDAAIGAPYGAPIVTNAGADMAFMRDAAAMVACGADDAQRIFPRLASEWRPLNGPLQPSAVVAEAVWGARRIGAENLMSDQWARAHLLEHCRAAGVPYIARPDNGAHWEFARRALQANRFSLPRCGPGCDVCADGNTCLRMIAQLRRVRVVPDGPRLKYEHPRTEGAHGDLAESFAIGAYQVRNANAQGERTLGARAAFGGGYRKSA